MTQDAIAAFIAELKEAFPGTKTAVDGSQTLVRLPAVAFPRGCRPEETEALVVLRAGANPELYIKVIPSRPDGGTPRSTGATTIAGESWCTFSFNLAWDAGRHSAEQFVYGRLGRFALNE
jgi:hypothetical protein